MSVSDYFLSDITAFCVLVFTLGLVVGSFLNVVIHRLPKMMESSWRQECEVFLELKTEAEAAPATKYNLVTPNSHCPACGHAIQPWENIPVISYLFLRGRCSSCKTHISFRYPAIELTTALLALVSALVLGPGLQSLILILMVWVLLTLSMIDIDHQLLPDDLVLPLMWAGLLFNLITGFVALSDAVIGAIAGYMSLWTVYWAFKLLTKKEGMGYGDFKLLAALGAWLGWQSLLGIIMISAVLGSVIGIISLKLQDKENSTPIPFGPYLAGAGWIYLLWGDQITAWYFSLTAVQ